jgi:SAM-dependent methyltransferase
MQGSPCLNEGTSTFSRTDGYGEATWKQRIHILRTRGLSEVTKRLGDIADIVHRFSHPPQVLEIGCGFGHAMRDLAQECPRARVRGMNLERYPEQLPNQEYLYGDASSEIPIEDNSIDFVYSIVAIYFMPDRARLIEEVFRILRPGGQMRCNFLPIADKMPEEYKNTDVVEGVNGVETLHGLLLSLPKYDITTSPTEIHTVTIMKKHPGDPPLKLGLVPVPEKRVDYGDVGGEQFEGFLRNWYRFSAAD